MLDERFLYGAIALMLIIILNEYVFKKYLHFDVKAPIWAQILKVALGLALLLGLKSGLKLVFPDGLFFYGLRYCCVTLFATCVWPLTFPWFARGCKRRSK